MSLVSMFKKPTPPEPPALAALRAHDAQMQAITTRQLKLKEREGATQDEVRRADAQRQKVDQLKTNFHAKRIAAAVNEQTPSDATAEREAIEREEALLGIMKEREREALELRAALHAEAEKLTGEYNAMLSVLARRTHEALIEKYALSHPAFVEAEARFHEVYKQTFTIAAAIDHVSTLNGFKVFAGANRYTDQHMPLPLLPPYTIDQLFNSARTLSELHTERARMESDAQALIASLLKDTP